MGVPWKIVGDRSGIRSTVSTKADHGKPVAPGLGLKLAKWAVQVDREDIELKRHLREPVFSSFKYNIIRELVDPSSRARFIWTTFYSRQI